MSGIRLLNVFNTKLVYNIRGKQDVYDETLRGGIISHATDMQQIFLMNAHYICYLQQLFRLLVFESCIRIHVKTLNGGIHFKMLMA